jgi:hypothetical protein
MNLPVADALFEALRVDIERFLVRVCSTVFGPHTNP